MIKLICVGTVKEKSLKSLLDEYLKRLKGFHKIEVIEVVEANPSFEETKRIEQESKSILNLIHSDDFLVLLDLSGKKFNSLSLATNFDGWLSMGKNLVFVVGGSDGVSQLVKVRANICWSVSDQTFPHQLFRVMLLEQIYRCFKINANQPYHK